MSPAVLFLLLMAPGEKETLTRATLDSGRVIELVTPPSERIETTDRIAPGAPPLLSFRYFEGQQRHRFGNLDLVMDDAAH